MTPPLTCLDVAVKFGVTHQAVARWAANGVLAGQKTSGGMWLFDPAVVAEFTPPRRKPKKEGCDVDGCGKPHHSLGLCKPHYQRQSRTGSVRADVPVSRVWFGQYGRGRVKPTVDLIDTDEL